MVFGSPTYWLGIIDNLLNPLICEDFMEQLVFGLEKAEWGHLPLWGDVTAEVEDGEG